MDPREFSPTRNKRAYEDVASMLREMVLSGRLKEGDKLPPERELAQRMGVGRHALREALRVLEMAGLIETRLGKWGGTFVTSGTAKSVANQMTDLLRLGNVSYASVIEARILFGDLVVRAAIERHTPEDVAELEANINEAERLFAEGRLAEKTERNIEFHDILARATKNPILVIMMQTLTDLARHFFKTIGPDPARTTVRSRRLFMKAFVARDADAAAQEMRASLLRLHTVHVDLATRRRAPARPSP